MAIRAGLAGLQAALFPEATIAPVARGRRRRGKATTGGSSVSDDKLTAHHEATTRYRVHAAMLLKADVEGGPDFLRLANALSALYPCGAKERRLPDATLLAAPK